MFAERTHFLGLLEETDRSIEIYYFLHPGQGRGCEASRGRSDRFSRAKEQGSCGRLLAVGDVQRLIEAAFVHEANHHHFGPARMENAV
jgi:hypothetical protein